MEDIDPFEEFQRQQEFYIQMINDPEDVNLFSSFLHEERDPKELYKFE